MLRDLRWRRRLEFGDMRSNHFILPFLTMVIITHAKGGRNNGRWARTYMLQLSQNIFSDAIFVEFRLNRQDDIVDDSSVDGRLENSKISELSPVFYY